VDSAGDLTIHGRQIVAAIVACACLVSWGALGTGACGRKDADPASGATAADAATGSEKAAQEAAIAWLALVDGGQYAQSWDEAASAFRRAVDQPGWTRRVAAVRTPLGALRSRTLKSARYATSLPGAPDGEYVVLQFDATFEHKMTAVETVTPMKDTDGRWRVSGYFIR
jgi:hypothetical protein